MRVTGRTTGKQKVAIPLVDLARDYNEHSGAIRTALEKVIESGVFVLGENVQQFEREFSSYCSARYGVGVGTGTDALTISLMALDIGKGDEVITVANTASPTAMAVLNVGAKPVFVDPSPETFVMDVSNLEEAMTRRTKAIIPVHLYGNPCNMRTLVQFSRLHNLFIVEDCCQAHGALFEEKPVGSFGDAGCFSFYPTKNLGSFGDAGMIITNSKILYERMRALRVYGMKSGYISLERGLCSRLDEIQATILRQKLKWLTINNNRRREIANLYKEQLMGSSSIALQKMTPCSYHVYHLFVVAVRRRDRLRRYLSRLGIGTGVHYPVALCDQPAFNSYVNKKSQFPVSRRLAREVLSLPIGPYLEESTIRFICKETNAFLSRRV